MSQPGKEELQLSKGAFDCYENEYLSEICQNFLSVGAEESEGLQTHQNYRFENFRVNQTQILSPPSTVCKISTHQTHPNGLFMV